jgi:hypothetical protein
MKLPVSIDFVMEEWSKDSMIDETEPGRELIKISKLHSKYLMIMSHHNLLVKKFTVEYNRLKKLRWEYYSGDLNNPEDLETLGLEPWLKKTLRQDIPMYIDSDQLLNNILLKRTVHQEIVDVCQSILKELQNRTWQLKSFIDWEKFSSGG